MSCHPFPSSPPPIGRKADHWGEELKNLEDVANHRSLPNGWRWLSNDWEIVEEYRAPRVVDDSVVGELVDAYVDSVRRNGAAFEVAVAAGAYDGDVRTEVVWEIHELGACPNDFDDGYLELTHLVAQRACARLAFGFPPMLPQGVLGS